MRKKYRYILFIIFSLSLFSLTSLAKEHKRVLVIQSYTAERFWNEQLRAGFKDCFKDMGVEVELFEEYLNADYWDEADEKKLMNEFCQRAEHNKIDLIITVCDEAFYTLFACGHSLPHKIPIVFLGLKHPKWEMINGLQNISGVIADPDYITLLNKAKKLFPQRKEVVCLIDGSFNATEHMNHFIEELDYFIDKNPDYSYKFYNLDEEVINDVMSIVCQHITSANKIVLVPHWVPIISFLANNSLAPFFSCQNQSMQKGVTCIYDADVYNIAYIAAKKAVFILQGHSPLNLNYYIPNQSFYYDYDVVKNYDLDYGVILKDGEMINYSFMDHYFTWVVACYFCVVGLLIIIVFFLFRLKRQEKRKNKKAETKLIVQAELLKQRIDFDKMLHSIGDGLVLFDLDSKISFINASFKKMFRFRSQEVLEERLSTSIVNELFLFLDENENEETLLKLLHQTITSLQKVAIPRNVFLKNVLNNLYFPISGDFSPVMTDGKITGVLLSVRNISKQEMQKQYFDMAVQQNKIYPWQFDMLRKKFVFPKNFLLHIGYSTFDMITYKKMLGYVHPDDYEIVEKVREDVHNPKNRLGQVDFRILNAEGKYEYWEFRYSISKSFGITTNYNILGVCQNIQKFKDKENDLLEARDKALESDKLKTAFLANMSHEIRTPLNAIVGFSDLLIDTSDFTQEEVNHFIMTINKNCNILLTLINDILDLSRIESGTMEFKYKKTNLVELLKNIYNSKEHLLGEKVEFILNLSDTVIDKPMVVTDYVRLHQVITNLVNNAFKFTTEGSVTLSSRLVPDTDDVEIVVEDTGIGIDEEQQKSVFIRFFKADKFTRGAGLGLSICHVIVQKLGGNISLESTLNKGSRFIIRLPRHIK